VEREMVEAAVLSLQSRGERVTSRSVRTVLGQGSYRDINAALRELDTEAAAMIPAHGTVVPEETRPLVPSAGEAADAVPPGTTSDEPTPLTLLQRAERAFEAAREAENRAKRAYDFALQAERPSCEEVFRRRCMERRQLQQQVDDLRKGKENLIQGIQDGRVALRYVQSGPPAAMDAKFTVSSM
jgi:hypothetical protein